MAIERNNSFHLLLSDDELKLLKLLAERDGLNASDYLRMVLRMMPSTNSPTIAQVTRLGATLGSLSLEGKVDLAKLFEAHSDAVRLAKSDVEETKKKKAK
jgi:predicted DNA binding CopG/RHH family protein